MSTLTDHAVTVDLAAGHAGPDCLHMAAQTHAQLTRGYTHSVSTMPLDGTIDGYLADHRTARKRAAHAARLGYRFATIDRHQHEDAIFHINTSTPERQGRPMSAGYLERPVFGANPVRCSRHHVYTYGVLAEDLLVAYLWLYRVGELAMVSSILGHADRLADDVMYLLVTGTVREQIEMGGTLFYNRHDSGTDGLRYFKERVGLSEGDVTWLL